MKPFIRVKSKVTGHQFDVHRSRFDPERHELVKRAPDSWHPRRPKHRVALKSSVPVAEPAEESASPIESVGTEEGEGDS